MTTTGERRRLQVSPEWTTDQLLLHLLSSQTTAREYYVSQAGHVVVRGQSLALCSDFQQLFEINPKSLFTIELSRDSNDVLFGFSVESELICDDLCVYVSRVERYVCPVVAVVLFVVSVNRLPPITDFEEATNWW